ncbi:hypothetical protein Tsubulata_041106 [Turnera subulata]|uniref:Snakin-2 n=1 Tax=Turnera subulata TaxID=218843 RepID=A0A9Q0JI41_9ROSI|nr:hypothetical protein Tsubulata_041106 [Turnera subulata]
MVVLVFRSWHQQKKSDSKFLPVGFELFQVSSDLNIDVPQISQARYYFHEFLVVVRGGNRRLMQELDCGKLCNQRCILHSRPKLCNRACGTCCVRCKCVPPGTSGNREVCGTCYTGMTTHGNKTKCP